MNSIDNLFITQAAVLATNALFNRYYPNGLLNLSFNAVVGHGKRTYHQLDKSKKSVKITIGKEMVAIHCGSESRIQNSRATDEIKKYNFCQSKTNPSTLITHIVLHEFAHLIQVQNGGRTKGSVHNTHFYNELKKLYRDGMDSFVTKIMNDDLKKHNLSLPTEFSSESLFNLNNSIPPLPNTNKYQPSDFNIGDVVDVDFKGNLREMLVQRVNPKTLSVECLSDQSKWRVGYGIVKNKKSKSEINTNLINNKSFNTNKYQLSDFKVGDVVDVDFKGNLRQMLVQRVNQKTLSVQCLSDQSEWRVSYRTVKNKKSKAEADTLKVESKPKFSMLSTIFVMIENKKTALTITRVNQKTVTAKNPQSGASYRVPFSLIMEQ